MIETRQGAREGAEMGPSVPELSGFLHRLSLPSPASDDATRLDRVTVQEQIKAAAAAAQARETAAFKASQLAEQKAAGVAAGDLGKGISAQLALARRESPHRGSRLVGLADALVSEMPHTMAALTAGSVSEWRATIVARETACLSREDRALVDARLAGRLGDMSDRQVMVQTRRHAYEVDAASVVARSRRAAADRRVTIRPAPDTMTVVSALLPAAQGVALYAALTREADRQRAAGDPRGRGQVMADTLVERVTGQTTADRVPVKVQLMMTDQTLLAGDDTPARLDGYGPVPASIARDLVRDLEDDTRAWIRRLFCDPCTGQLVASGLQTS